MIKNIIITIFLSLIFVSACGESTPKATNKVDTAFPITNDKKREIERGSVLGEAGGFNLLGSNKSNNKVNGTVGGVNAYLWRASLDVISFMPLNSADAIGGIIITDWYAGPESQNERIKANINITSTDLRASGIKVSIFKQQYSKGRWIDGRASDKLERGLENKILARARQLKISEERR